MWLQSLNIGAATVAFQAPATVQVSTNSIASTVVVNWHYRQDAWPHVSDSAWSTVQLSDTSLSMTMQIGLASSTGKPTLAVVSTNVAVGSFSMSTSGLASWLYSAILSIFRTRVSNALQAALAGALQSAVTSQLNSFVAALPVRAPIDSTNAIALDMSLTSAPQISPAAVVTYHVGLAARQPSGPDAVPDSPAISLPGSNTGANAQFEVAQTAFSSAASVYAEMGAFDRFLTSLPAGSPLALTVNDFSQMVPALLEYFQPSQALVANLTMVKPLLFTSTAASGLSAECVFELAILATPLDASSDDVHLLPAYTLGIDLSLAGVVQLANNPSTGAPLLQGSLAYMNAAVSLLASNVGEFDVTTSSQVLAFALHQVVVPHINSVLAAGVPLPVVAGVSLHNELVTYADGYVNLSADMQLTPALFAKLLGGS